jgi:hypothetical protein
MPERVAATRAGLLLALVFTLPLLLWMLGQAVLSSAGQFDLALPLGGMMNTALLLQSCSLALGLPWLMRFQAPLDRCCAVAMLLLVPGPLYAVAALSGAVSATGILYALGGLAALALLLYGVYAGCLRLAAAGRVRSILLLSAQLIGLGLCWHYRQLWQQVFSQ